jgi:hypothetical protein
MERLLLPFKKLSFKQTAIHVQQLYSFVCVYASFRSQKHADLESFLNSNSNLKINLLFNIELNYEKKVVRISNFKKTII